MVQQKGLIGLQVWQVFLRDRSRALLVQRLGGFMDSLAPLNIGEVQDYNKLKTDVRFRDVRSVCVQKSRVIRTRPRFNTWSCEFDMMYDETKIDTDAVILAVENAGSYIGLCEMRTMGYGRFAAAVEEVEFVA